jgi:hypothetical protein
MLAVSCAVFVLFLAALAVSPRLHAWIHGVQDVDPCCSHSHHEGTPHDDSGCAVSLFAQGLVVDEVFRCPDGPIELRSAPVEGIDDCGAAPHAAHRLPPGRAPPQRV